MKKGKYEDWTSLAIRKETKKLIDELAKAITKKENRFTECSKHEAVHQAVSFMFNKLSSEQLKR